MGNKTYNIITIGCQMNKSDSERVAGYLENLGYKWSNNKYQADLVVVNTCGVRQSAEDRVYGIIPRIKKQNSKVKIILTGCLSERKDVQKRLRDKVDIWLPITQISNFQFLISNKISNPKSQIPNYLELKPKYQSKFSAFVPIGNGCDNFCTYCVVPNARGREIYRPVNEIIDEARELVERGYKEIILIAQNVNSYNSPFTPKNANPPAGGRQKINFASLLKLINNIPGNFWIRFATSHPKDMSGELIKTIAECDKICRHIHLPAQAGDNEILKKMNRGYTVEHYKKLIKRIRQAMPNASITTDIIVGFPGETKRQFNRTVKLFKEMKFDMAYIAQYSSRPGTAAEKLDDDAPKEEKKRRERELMVVLRKTALENNKKYIGKAVDVLVEGKNKKGEWYGKTRTSKNVKIKIQTHCDASVQGKKDLVGEFVKVKINRARDFGLKGEVA
ncbi:MAG: tRNA (N6-isopentenyl adenosine(37)-C2)-methylthiotransferase MiaB [Patescibacteria group bacterium]|nr:tRNA (N6-isopentenyl adenosine(37)-C2)-methylthiotransferase MiaB [Patescibacteria group bacterium]